MANTTSLWGIIQSDGTHPDGSKTAQNIWESIPVNKVCDPSSSGWIYTENQPDLQLAVCSSSQKRFHPDADVVLMFQTSSCLITSFSFRAPGDPGFSLTRPQITTWKMSQICNRTKPFPVKNILECERPPQSRATAPPSWAHSTLRENTSLLLERSLDGTLFVLCSILRQTNETHTCTELFINIYTQ